MANAESFLEGSNHLRLDEITDFKPFDCGDSDLNEFFNIDSFKFQKQLLSVTYVIASDIETIAFYSLSNDKISKYEIPENNPWNAFRKKQLVKEKSRLSSYPCVKIGRLGVNKNYQSKGIGEFLLNKIKLDFVTNNKTGCRFITVDAYNNEKTIAFYRRNGFDFLPIKMSEGDNANIRTKLMYFDLIQISNALEIPPDSPKD